MGEAKYRRREGMAEWMMVGEQWWELGRRLERMDVL